MSSSAEQQRQPEKTPEEEEKVVGTVKQLKSEQSMLINKMNELEAELSEHRVVCESMKKVEPTRRCYRLVGGVLVERTAGEVLPAVEQSRDGIEKALQELQKALQQKSKQLETYMQEHNVRFVSEDEAQAFAEQEQQQREQQKEKEKQKGTTAQPPQGVLI